KSRSFVQRLYYDTGSGSGFVPRYNGNIAGIGYEQNGHSYNYLFLYDGLNRLTAANSYDKTGGSIPYSELYEYDRMGNITYLERKLGENKTDALNIQYTGNHVKKVSSGSPVSGYDFGSMSYPDLSDASIEYYYDNNGNLIKNLDKGVVATRHNFLNLPDTIQFQNGNQIINSYLADGRKVKAIYKTYSTGIVVPQDAVYHGNASYSTSTDEWDGHYMYRSWYGDTPRMFMVQTPEGYVGADYVGIDSHRNYAYYYYVHDHLGNVRITRNSQGYYADQSLEYYPSGVLFGRSTEKERQPYMFGGKELVSMHGLNEYDFTGRWQYSIIPSFTSMDPLCEKYYSVSPYVYCLNNPLKYVDPDGNQPRPLRPPVRRGYRNAGRPNPYVFYPRGIKPQSYMQITNLSYTGNGLRQIMPIGPQTFLETVNTPGGNRVQINSNNIPGRALTGFGEYYDSYIDFKNKLASLVSTVKYGEDGVIQNSTELVINDPNLAIQQLSYEAKAAEMNESLGELDFTGKSLEEMVEMSTERKAAIQEKLGLSPKDLIMIELFTNPNAFQSTQQERRILPEFNQR
ncbi:RHS repeat-associated core domain-containing protein, partial [Bacteroides salyersiae]|uniref:RHS repeat-associated core domain-containing protein n=1 Tax=Bacteroides salyersiae TaxID=291644 RepID=UPI0024C5A8C5